jgi:hypothetical protein
MHIGDARVVDTRVNPLARLDVTSDGSSIAVSYGRGGRTRTLARLDATSLERLSTDSVSATRDGGEPAAGAVRAPLDGGRFLMVWKRGSAEWGYRAMAQEFGVDGTPRGEAVVVSPPDFDVTGALHAVATSGHRVVVTFAGTSGDTFELVAVPLESETAAAAGERVAGR